MNPIPENAEEIKFLCRDGSVETLSNSRFDKTLFLGEHFGYLYTPCQTDGHFVFDETEPHQKDIIGICPF